jgi:DNA-binding CsgD family transcriptional regulator
MRPLGLGDELRAALVAGTQCWGYLYLHREDHRTGLSRAEAALITRLGPHIAHAVRHASLLRRAPAESNRTGPGVILLDDGFDIIGCTPQAQDLLGGVLNPRPTGRPVPLAVYAVARVLQGIEQGTVAPNTLPTARVHTAAGGWLTLHASRMRGDPATQPITIVVEPAESHTLVGIALSAHNLSPREQEVARLVLRGVSTTGISDALHISRHTVQDHLKSVFDKVGCAAAETSSACSWAAPQTHERGPSTRPLDRCPTRNPARRLPSKRRPRNQPAVPAGVAASQVPTQRNLRVGAA